MCFAVRSGHYFAKSIAKGIVLAMLLVLSACRSSERPTVAPDAVVDAHGGARSELRPLDEAHAGEFRRAFDESREHRRYVVALSPT